MSIGVWSLYSVEMTVKSNLSLQLRDSGSHLTLKRVCQKIPAIPALRVAVLSPLGWLRLCSTRFCSVRAAPHKSITPARVGEAVACTPPEGQALSSPAELSEGFLTSNKVSGSLLEFQPSVMACRHTYLT